MSNKMSDWVDINIRYIKHCSDDRLDSMLENDLEYAQHLDELLRVKYLELYNHDFDKLSARFDELSKECLCIDTEEGYDLWENLQEFKSLQEKIKEINSNLNTLIDPIRDKIEKIRKYYINKEALDSFVGLGLNKVGTEVVFDYVGNIVNVTLTEDIIKLLGAFALHDSLRVIKYRVPLENVSN